jgi:hypothetical protein
MDKMCIRRIVRHRLYRLTCVRLGYELGLELVL